MKWLSIIKVNVKRRINKIIRDEKGSSIIIGLLVFGFLLIILYVFLNAGFGFNLFDWIYDKIITPVINGIKSLF